MGLCKPFLDEWRVSRFIGRLALAKRYIQEDPTRVLRQLALAIQALEIVRLNNSHKAQTSKRWETVFDLAMYVRAFCEDAREHAAADACAEVCQIVTDWKEEAAKEAEDETLDR
jgi:hypothetical protein